ERIVDALQAHAQQPLDIEELRSAAGGVPQRKAQIAAKWLTDAGALVRQPDGRLMLQDATEGHAAAKRAAAHYHQRAAQDQATLEAMVLYARSGTCRWRRILDHFGDSPVWQRCQHC